MFDLPSNVPQISLGEGNTPLVWAEAFGKQVAFKLEFLNPTGSFKDRGTALLVSILLSRGVSEAVEDSSGNAGSSFAAYAAAAEINARVFIPDYASGPKRAQIEAYGAEVIPIPGPRSKAAEAVVREVERGVVYASHAYMPFGERGFSTVAYELVEQLGQVPGSVISPAGQGNLLLGLGRGFAGMRQAGLIQSMPALVGVQAEVCAPLWAVYTGGFVGLSFVSEGHTLAEGVRIQHPLRGDALLQLVVSTGGQFIAVPEEAILTGRDQLARRGLFVEPTSAIVWYALEQLIDNIPEPVVILLTGSGLKSVH